MKNAYLFSYCPEGSVEPQDCRLGFTCAAQTGDLDSIVVTDNTDPVCDEGYYSGLDNIGTAGCIDCPLGYYCPLASYAPTPCPVLLHSLFLNYNYSLEHTEVQH
jgi:hypothetical protein